MLRNDAEPARALERYAEDLRRMARARLRATSLGEQDASDLVQQTLLTAYEKHDQFHGATHGEFLCWLRSILRRKLAEQVRRHARGRSGRTNDGMPTASPANLDESTPSRRAIRGEELLRLAAAMADLPDDQRIAMELHHFQSLSVNEIAARMGRTTDAVGGLLFRGTRTLRRRML